ncbi:MAG: GH92 family glycosyl hydrolase, partial [Armatimonadota bacterium]|nr:GH92 family glycosyl hydrolase [Armatimonadota bacterium]
SLRCAAILAPLLIARPVLSREAPLIRQVNPFIGTAGGGNTFPGATAPFGMVQFSPDTQRGGVGYDYGDRVIHGFSMLHMSGIGCADYGDVFMTATTGPVEPSEAAYSSPFLHSKETASPGYYSVTLDKSNVKVELSAALRGGMARFTFPAGQAGNFLLPISHTQVDTNAADVNIVGDREMNGQVTSQGFCGGGSPYTVYYVIQFDRPFAQYGTWTNGAVSAGQRTAHQPDRKTDVGAYATFAPASDGATTVTARIGISFVDLEGARNNLARSIGERSFDAVRRDADQNWERALHDIEITGGSTTERTNFYTALYHAMLMPNTFNDADGRYPGFDQKVHRIPDGHALYANFSGWDIYRTQVPLLALIEPARLQDMAQSLVLEYQQDGRFDRWPMANTRTGVMNGEPTTSIQATAWNYGLHGFDMAASYPGMLKAATDYGTRIIADRGYQTDGVSDMQEYCYSIGALKLVADSLGKTEDSAQLKTWAEDVFNLYNPATGFFQPRSRTGEWKTPFDPTQGDGYVEGTAWHYLWLVPQDVAGLIARMGGDETFNRRLDQFFSYPRPTWAGQYYNPYNEPDLQAPFLYDFSGQPWKTQARVRELQKDVYFPSPGGIPGNDDCGTMSAWYVLSSMGLYAVDPGRPVMELTSPLWAKTVVRLQPPYTGKQFTITASGQGSSTPYVQSLSVNGQTTDQPWIPVGVLTRGGSVSFTLGAAPNENWGAAEAVRPPSMSRE